MAASARLRIAKENRKRHPRRSAGGWNRFPTASGSHSVQRNASPGSSQAPGPKTNRKMRFDKEGAKGAEVMDEYRNTKGRNVSGNNRDTCEE